MDRKILTYDSVEISFGGKAVVHDVSFSLEHGEILGLVGESGSGKSTLIKAAMGLLGQDGLVTRGDIRYMDQNILDISEKEKRKIRGAGIGMIFQDAGASLCPIRTIGEQIYESMRAHTKITRSEAKSRAMDLFAKLNFKDSQRVWDSYPFELSGGMNQRAGIAIAMLMNPPILFADEPTSALDVTVQKQVVEELLLMLMRHSVMNEKEPDLLNSRDADILLATKYIYNNFRKPLTLEEVSSVASLSPTYFSKKFKLITGMGFKEYLNYVRLKHAQTALLTTDSSITDIALEYGFNDSNYFKDLFKKVYGKSPREYRKNPD